MLSYQTSGVPVKKHFDLKVPIVFAGRIKYQFWTDSHDIAFSLFFESSSGVRHVLVPEERIDCSMDPMVGSNDFKTKGGWVVFSFDNSYSWLREKSLSYHIVLEPVDATARRVLRHREARAVLRRAAEDLTRAERRMSRTEAATSELKGSLNELEATLQSLQAQIAAKKHSLKELQTETSFLEHRIHIQRQQQVPRAVVALVQEGGWLTQQGGKVGI